MGGSGQVEGTEVKKECANDETLSCEEEVSPPGDPGRDSPGHMSELCRGKSRKLGIHPPSHLTG